MNTTLQCRVCEKIFTAYVCPSRPIIKYCSMECRNAAYKRNPFYKKRMGYQKGHIPWIKGKTHLETTKEKIARANSGENNPNYGKPPWNKGTKGVCRANSGSAKKGCVSCMSGKHHSVKSKEKISQHSLSMWHDKNFRGKMCKIRQNTCPKGDKHWHWKGNVTPIQEQTRKCFLYRQWRSDVFVRDDFTCQNCGIRGAKLEAHHYLESFSNIFEKYRIKTIKQALECEELWNINNGKTLCLKCHKLNEFRWHKR